MIFKGFISCCNKTKLLINNKEIFGKYSNIWELNNIPLNANGSKKEITQELRKYIGINENDNVTHPNFQDVIKSKFRKNIYMHIVEEKNCLKSLSKLLLREVSKRRIR